MGIAVYRRGLIALVFCLLPGAVMQVAGQREADHWHFGYHLGIDFSKQPPVAITNSQLRTLEGSASYSDPRTGRLLLYTSGFDVWNRNNELMSSSADFLPADRKLWPLTWSTTQAALVVPHPGKPDLFYIFNAGNITNRRPSDLNAQRLFWEFSYILVDMSKQGGSGEIVEARTLGPSVDMTEKVTGTGYCAGTTMEYWVITQVLTPNAFYAYKVTAGGVDATPVISNVELFNRSPQTGGGQMKLSPDGTMLATVNSRLHDRQPVHLYRFDVQTGRVSDPLPIYFNVPGGARIVYGMSFSPDNSRLYILERHGGVYQLTVDPYTLSSVNASRVLLADREEGFDGQMQIGPDRRIYIARSHAASLGVINFPNRAGQACEIGVHELTVDESASPTESIRIGLPNFMDHIFDAGPKGCGEPLAAFTIAELCEGSCVQPQDRSSNILTDWRWFFEGGNPSEWEGPDPPPICYERAGTYEARLEVRNAAGSSSATRAVLVHARPAVDAGEDIRICRGGSVKLQAGGTGRMRWHTSASLSAEDIPDPIARPEETSEYIVTLTDERGCENRDTVLVIVDTVTLEVSGSQSICVGESAQLEAGGASRYEWRPAEGLNDPQIPNPLANPLRSTTYTVTAFNEFGCSSTATVRVNVLPQPVAYAGRDTSICAGATLQLRGSGGERYQWRPVEGISDPASASPLVSPRRSTRYFVTAFNGENCTSSASVMVTVLDPPELQLSGAQRICPGAGAQLSAGGAVRYEWLPTEGLDDPSSPRPIAAPLRSTVYSVMAYDEAGCVTSGSVRVEVEEVAPGGVRASRLTICAGESAQLEAFGGERYRWSPAEGLSASDIADPIASPASNTRYTVHIENGACSGDYEVEVIVAPVPELIVSGASRICSGESTVLRASGGLRYEWQPAQGLDDPLSATPVATPDETTLYSVRSWNEAGCVSSATLRLEVRPWRPATLRLPEITATPGEELLLPIEMDVPEEYLPVRIERLRFELRFDGRPLALRGLESAELLDRRQQGDHEVLLLELRDIVLEEARSVISSLRIIGLIALQTSSALELNILQADFASETCLDLLPADGSFAIHDYCIGYSLSFAPRLRVQVQPNPARSNPLLRIAAHRDGAIRLRLVNNLGRTVLTSTQAGSAGQTLELELKTYDLPAGLYFLTAENGGQSVRSRLLLLP